jgi:hypothetical protein
MFDLVYYFVWDTFIEIPFHLCFCLSNGTLFNHLSVFLVVAFWISAIFPSSNHRHHFFFLQVCIICTISVYFVFSRGISLFNGTSLSLLVSLLLLGLYFSFLLFFCYILHRHLLCTTLLYTYVVNCCKCLVIGRGVVPTVAILALCNTVSHAKIQTRCNPNICVHCTLYQPNISPVYATDRWYMQYRYLLSPEKHRRWP